LVRINGLLSSKNKTPLGQIKDNEMKKHVIPIIYMVCLTITIITVLYQHFEKGGVTGSGWGMLAIVISGNLMQINHWKEYFKK
jgi:hypothetical protein